MLSKNAATAARWLYWILMIGAQLAISAGFFYSGRSIAGAIWLAVGLFLTVIFYSVFFPQGNSTASHAWPPHVASCPDYLTQIRPTQCVDLVGLNSPHLKRSDPTNLPGPGDGEYIFKTSSSLSQNAALCQQYGLSWEGVV